MSNKKECPAERRTVVVGIGGTGANVISPAFLKRMCVNMQSGDEWSRFAALDLIGMGVLPPKTVDLDKDAMDFTLCNARVRQMVAPNTERNRYYYPEHLARVLQGGGDAAAFTITGGLLQKYTGTQTEVVIPQGVTQIGYGVFHGCSEMTSVTIPDSVRYIDQGAFASCSGLTAITLPNQLVEIEPSVFRNCSGLTEVVLPDRLSTIGWAAFRGCSGLTSIAIPDGVCVIRGCAFAGCSSLTSITIPSSVSTSLYGVFNGCSNLCEIISDHPLEEFVGTPFYERAVSEVADEP